MKHERSGVDKVVKGFEVQAKEVCWIRGTTILGITVEQRRRAHIVPAEF